MGSGWFRRGGEHIRVQRQRGIERAVAEQRPDHGLGHGHASIGPRPILGHVDERRPPKTPIEGHRHRSRVFGAEQSRKQVQRRAALRDVVLQETDEALPARFDLDRATQREHLGLVEGELRVARDLGERRVAVECFDKTHARFVDESRERVEHRVAGSAVHLRADELVDRVVAQHESGQRIGRRTARLRDPCFALEERGPRRAARNGRFHDPRRRPLFRSPGHRSSQPGFSDRVRSFCFFVPALLPRTWVNRTFRSSGYAAAGRVVPLHCSVGVIAGGGSE